MRRDIFHKSFRYIISLTKIKMQRSYNVPTSQFQIVLNQNFTRAVYFTGTVGYIYAFTKFQQRTLWVNTRDEKSYSDSNERVVESKLTTIKNFFTILIYRLLPWRILSRTWGKVCRLEGIPDSTRLAILRWYVNRYGVDLSEAERENIEEYLCLSDLFQRRLKRGARIINKDSPLVSPSDGQIMVLGQVDEIKELLKQVKGKKFSLGKFLGQPSWNEKVTPKSNTSSKSKTIASRIKKYPSSETTLQYVVIYLSPGDYHRFHSPAEWTVFFRRHFSGELLSVGPSVLAFINELFSINERVVYVGEWTYGFISMTPVGATNVGTILVYEDPALVTNTNYIDSELRFKKPPTYVKGEDFGEFNLGSTIVLIFECPKDMEFSVKIGDKVKVGNGLLRKKIL